MPDGRVFSAESTVLHAITGETRGIIFSCIPGTPTLQTAVPVTVTVSPQILIKGAKRIIEFFKISPIFADQIIHFQSGHRKAESLQPVIGNLQKERLLIFNHAGQPSALSLIFHENELIVQCGFHIAFGIHFAAHGLCFQPDTVIIGAFPKHLFISKDCQISYTMGFTAFIEFHKPGCVTSKLHARLR